MTCEDSHDTGPCARPECRHARRQLAESVPLIEWEAWREVAIALVSEIADELLDPNSMAMQAYQQVRNHRFADAISTARDSLIISGAKP